MSHAILVTREKSISFARHKTRTAVASKGDNNHTHIKVCSSMQDLNMANPPNSMYPNYLTFDAFHPNREYYKCCQAMFATATESARA